MSPTPVEQNLSAATAVFSISGAELSLEVMFNASLIGFFVVCFENLARHDMSAK